MPLTPTQEDYLETIYRLDQPLGGGVRAKDIAGRLGCRLPTVTRTVRRLAELGYVDHRSRGLVRLTPKGLRAAENLAHRHRDTISFLTRILGVSEAQARVDACRIEHGLSPLASQRLHEFLNYIDELDASRRTVIDDFARQQSETVSDFAHLPERKATGRHGQ
ncbi:MAG TPA: metal-dependent transcriptional regulator [Acidobacteriota bacterium]|nr:metal-dependent transcriptional regulator [Acidobacteriota bacterium]